MERPSTGPGGDGRRANGRAGALLCALALVLAAGEAAWAQVTEGTQTDDFESAKHSWFPLASDGAYRIVGQRRLNVGGRRGPGCEQLQVEARNNTYVYFMHAAGPAPLIDELQASVWVLADREGIQLLARIVLPRTIDPRSGRPRTTLVRGTSYARVGAWEELRIGQLASLLERQTPALRAELGPQVDTTGAYLDGLVLNAYGGPGTTTLWIDALDVRGIVSMGASGAAPGVETEPHLGAPSPAGAPPAAPRRIELVGSVLQLNSRPFVPRLLEYRGEPLTWIAERGFNGIWSSEAVRPEVLVEARRTGMAVICPPPLSPQGEPAFGSEHESVVAWHAGRRLTHAEFDAVRQRVAAVRRADPLARPIVAEVDSDLRLYSRHVDVLLLRRDPLGTTLELADYAKWLNRRPALARPGTPAWTVVQTQYDPVVAAQVAALASDGAAAAPEPEQIRLLTLAAVGAGAHGFLFRSDTRLDATDPAARVRALALEQVNLELAVLEPWLTGGQLVGQFAGNPPQVSAALLQLDRARVLVPIWAGRGAQLVPGQSAARDVTFVVPGVPEAHKAYEATAAGLIPLETTRVAGGKRLVLSEFGLAGAVVFAQDQDPHVLEGLNRKLDRSNTRAAELARDLASAKLAATQGVLRQLDESAQRDAVNSGWITAAQNGLNECTRLLTAGQPAEAYQAADRAMRPLRLLQRTQWTTCVSAAGSPVATPAAGSFAALGLQWQLWRQLSAAIARPNRLPGGDMENLDLCLRAGWRRVQNPRAELADDVELSAETPHGGTRSLRLRCEPRKADEAPTLLEAPVVWIETAPVELPPGTWFRVRGYVRVPRPIAASVDGLLVLDNCGGPALAERFGETQGWREFTLYRAAPASGPVVVTFALTGLGEAWIDDVTIEPLEFVPPATAARVQPAASRPNGNFEPPPGR